MRRATPVTALLMITVLVTSLVAAQGYVVILKNGHKIRCREPLRIEGDQAILTLATGTVASYPLSYVDLVETERYNQLGLGDALLIEELTVGTPVPTPTPRVSLGDVVTLDVKKNPELGSTSNPTPTPTPGIKLQSVPYGEERIDRAFSQFFDDRGLYLYRTSTGTRPDYFFVQVVTDSQREVFTALRAVAEAFTLIHELHQSMAPEAVELQMIQTSGKAAGTFRLTPELARELVSENTSIEQFYVKHVIF